MMGLTKPVNLIEGNTATTTPTTNKPEEYTETLLTVHFVSCSTFYSVLVESALIRYNICHLTT